MPNQEFGLVPIVEPEILIDGSHDITTTARIQERVLTTVYAKLQVLRTFALALALALTLSSCRHRCLARRGAARQRSCNTLPLPSPSP